MTYAFAQGLQAAVFGLLAADDAVTAAVGARLWDAPPRGDEGAAGPWISLGEETVAPWGARGLVGALHELEIGVHGPEDGFAAVKAAAAAVAAALEGASPVLAGGRVASAEFVGAKARKVAGGRRIDLRFRFRIEAQ